jgi:hypothetical protein
MPIEALFWSLLLVLSPALASRLWPSLSKRFDPLPIDIESLAHWIHGLGVPYLAIILGSVSSRKVGLLGLTAEAWFTGGLACALGLGMASFLMGRCIKPPDSVCKLDTILLEETRWAFYRGAAALWLPPTFSPLLGLGIAVLELGITQAIASNLLLPSPKQWKILMRAAFSTLLFLATGNFWLTAGTQLILTATLLKRTQIESTE